MKRLQKLPPTTPANPSDDSAIMMIQANVLAAPTQANVLHTKTTDTTVRGSVTNTDFSGQMTAIPSTSIEVVSSNSHNTSLQIHIPEMDGRTVAAQITSIEGIQAMIRDQTEEADRRIEELQPAILDLQVKVSQALAERGPLLAQRDSLRQAVTKLEMESSQAKAALEAQIGQVHLVAAAQAPVAPIARCTTRNGAVATILGLMLGVAVAFVIELAAARREQQASKPLQAGQI